MAAPAVARPTPAGPLHSSGMATSTTVRASKTWVLPPRPKPGRKSKKDLAAAAAKERAAATETVTTTTAAADEQDDEEAEEADRILNRSKQKASRERKQEYIAELEAKVRTYEQGDGERAAFFQGLAKTYSEENAALKQQLEELKTRLAALEAERSSHSTGLPTSIAVANRQASDAAAASSKTAEMQRRANSSSTVAVASPKASTSTGSSNAGTSAVASRQQHRRSLSNSQSQIQAQAQAHRPDLARKASSSSDFTTRPVKRQRTASVSSSSHPSLPVNGYTTISREESPYIQSHSPTSYVPHAHSPLPLPVGSHTHNIASPAASSMTSYAPPSPPVSLGTPVHRIVARGGCGLCDAESGISCICEDMGLRADADQDESYAHHHHDHDNDALMQDVGLLPPPAHDRCDFCTESTAGACLCAEVGVRKPVNITSQHGISGELNRAAALSSSTTVAAAMAAVKAASGTASTSVRLRLPKRGIAAGQIWHIAPAPSSAAQQQMQIQPVVAKKESPSPGASTPLNPGAAASVALRRRLIKVGSRLPCSGDPKTCLACADDPAGQAFCSALSSTVCSTNPCANCPNKPSPLGKIVEDSQAASAVPNVASAAPSSAALPDAYSTSAMPSFKRRDSSARDEVPQAMIPCSDAWATLREHPNIGYANLDLLASVVAKRTQCLGEQRDQDGKVIEVERQGVEEALEMLDRMRKQQQMDEKAARAK